MRKSIAFWFVCWFSVDTSIAHVCPFQFHSVECSVFELIAFLLMSEELVFHFYHLVHVLDIPQTMRALFIEVLVKDESSSHEWYHLVSQFLFQLILCIFLELVLTKRFISHSYDVVIHQDWVAQEKTVVLRSGVYIKHPLGECDNCE